MKIFLSTLEGYAKNSTDNSQKKFRNRNDVPFKNGFLHFSGNDAPVNAARAIMDKHGVSVNELLEKKLLKKEEAEDIIKQLIRKYEITPNEIDIILGEST